MTQQIPLQGEFDPVVPTRIVFGNEKIDALKDKVQKLGGKKALVLSGRRVGEKTGSVSRINDVLGGMSAGAYSGLTQRAPLAAAVEAANMAAANGVDTLVGVGGSTISDASRMIAVLMAEGITTVEQLRRLGEEQDMLLSPNLDGKELPLQVSIPTTLSAGRSFHILSNPAFDSAAQSGLETQARELHSAKRIAEAVVILRRVLAARLEAQGERHFQTINSRSGLARSLRAIHEYDECFLLYSENIRIHREKLGYDHPQTLRSLSRLANTYFAAGRYADARPMFEDILERRARVLGRDHPDTLRTQSSLANTLLELGRFAESAELHEKIIEDRVRVLGPDHVRTNLSRKRLDRVRQAARSG